LVHKLLTAILCLISMEEILTNRTIALGKYIFLLLLLMDMAAAGRAQTPFDMNPSRNDSLRSDSMNVYEPEVKRWELKKRFGRAVLSLGIAEMTPFLFNRYVTKKDYAYISFQTIGHNFKPGSWTWDNDGFQTNQFGHPYHGSLYFNSFRSNGYSFYQSIPGTVIGSYLWETLAENQEPAPNDFINTSFGGIVLGEMTHRFANKLINERQSGFKRQLSEIAALVINPANGFSRIVSGRWGRVNTRFRQTDSSKVIVEFDAGARRYKNDQQNFLTAGRFGWFGNAKLLYGDRTQNLKSPFSNVYVRLEFGEDDSSFVNNINVYGSLAGWQFRSVRNSRHLAILSANYDYIRNQAFFYGSQSVKMNLFSEYNLFSKTRFFTSAGLGAVLLAAVPHYYEYIGRDYAYCTGGVFSGGAGLSLQNRLFISVDYNGSILKTISGHQSHYFVHAVTAEARYQLTRSLGLLAAPGYFNLSGKYAHYADIERKYPFLKIAARYSFNI
jgi:hypothetical protein